MYLWFKGKILFIDIFILDEKKVSVMNRKYTTSLSIYLKGYIITYVFKYKNTHAITNWQ